jgi:hypothetical protein
MTIRRLGERSAASRLPTSAQVLRQNKLVMQRRNALNSARVARVA